MEIAKIQATDGETAVYINKVLIATYSSWDSTAQATIEKSIENLSHIFDCSIHTYLLEKNAGFVSWEKSEQASSLLNTAEVTTLFSSDDSLIDSIITHSIEAYVNDEKNKNRLTLSHIM